MIVFRQGLFPFRVLALLVRGGEAALATSPGIGVQLSITSSPTKLEYQMVL
jgi:hypothetical protein